jgi:hypothetical protein
MNKNKAKLLIGISIAILAVIGLVWALPQLTKSPEPPYRIGSFPVTTVTVFVSKPEGSTSLTTNKDLPKAEAKRLLNENMALAQSCLDLSEDERRACGDLMFGVADDWSKDTRYDGPVKLMLVQCLNGAASVVTIAAAIDGDRAEIMLKPCENLAKMVK